MNKYGLEFEYTVTEYIEVEAANNDEAEDKAREMLELGLTKRQIMGDTSEEAELVRSEKLDE